MELSQSDRIRWVVKWLATQRQITTAEVGKLLGYPSNTYFSQLINGRKQTSADFPQKLAALDPRINIDFQTGISDEMIVGEGAVEPKRQEPIQSPRVGIFVPPELTQMVTDLTAVIREQQAMIKTLVDAWVKKEAER